MGVVMDPLRMEGTLPIPEPFPPEIFPQELEPPPPEPF